ncbi:MAG TPA: hypothetical protein VII01_10405 [Solirubrobacteraceae bacterium]
MSSWDELIGGSRAEVLRGLLCKAAHVAHRENGARFAPEDLGDEALMYGLGTTINARHLAGRSIEDADLDGVAVCEHGRVWWLELQRPDGTAVRAYLYKAPPSARTVHDLRLDDTEIKKELSTSNGQQMALFNRSGGKGNAQLLNILIVHYGDAVTGLEKLDVGAPYVNGDEIAWDWYERFDSDAASADGTAPTAPVPLGDDGAGYEGLRLVPKEIEPAGKDHGSAAMAAPEPATSEFDALGLRDDLEKGDSDTGTGKEPS